MNPFGLLKKIREATNIFFGKPDVWKERAKKGMGLNFGWKTSIKVYESICNYLHTGKFPV